MIRMVTGSPSFQRDGAGEGVVPDRPVGVADHGGRAVDHAADLEHDAEVGGRRPRSTCRRTGSTSPRRRVTR